MASFPVYSFKDPNLDFNAVEVNLINMYSQVNARIGKKKSKDVPFTEINTQMLARLIDKTTNVERWKKDIEVAYKLLFPYS